MSPAMAALDIKLRVTAEEVSHAEGINDGCRRWCGRWPDVDVYV
jgi:hypothetical protein